MTVLLIHKQQTNLLMKLPIIPPGLVGKIVKYRPLSEPIRPQDLGDSALSQAWKKIMMSIVIGVFVISTYGMCLHCSFLILFDTAGMALYDDVKYKIPVLILTPWLMLFSKEA